MINLKSPPEIEIMRVGGRKLGQILGELLFQAKPGIALTTIEQSASQLIQQAGGDASFKTVGGYSWTTCLCVNEAVVHGIPSDYVLKPSDILTIDIGMLYKGLHTDTAWTKIVREMSEIRGQKEAEIELFLKTGEEALWRAIDQAQVGNRVGHISQAIQTAIEGAGYNVIKSLVGHGIGKLLHEKPQIPGHVRGSIMDSTPLAVGMTLAIEVIYSLGSGAIVYANDDGWTLATRDQSLSAVFEHTIAITAEGPVVLTDGNDLRYKTLS